MFTGIISDIGTVRAISRTGETRFDIETAFDPDGITMGASIACSGACLTVIEKGRESGKGCFAVEVSRETLNRSTLGDWAVGTRINLERSLKAGDELGGHIVSGHVDGVGKIRTIEPVGQSKRFVFWLPEPLRRFVAEKGSIAVDGISLTVNGVGADEFEVNIIPHTLSATTLGEVSVGQRVNLEIDMLARYVARLQEVPS